MARRAAGQSVGGGMSEDENSPDDNRAWTLLTNHGAALLYVAENPDATVREVADGIDITERATARILRDLRREEYMEAIRVGRRNTYNLRRSARLRHHVGRDRRVSDFLEGLERAD